VEVDLDVDTVPAEPEADAAVIAEAIS